MREIPKGNVEVVSLIRRAWSAFGRLGTIIAIALAFLLGMAGTVYLSLRSPEVKVPSIIGKDRQAAEDELGRAGLNIRVRATRYSADAKPNTVLLQLPHAGEVVKTGQTVAVDISRAQAKEGESSTSIANEQQKQEDEEKTKSGNKNEAQANANNQNANNSNNRNKNKNKIANNSNNRNANNANNRNNSNNANANRPPVNANNRNTANVTGNSNRTGNNTNANRRPPVTTPPFNPGSNSRP
jgi:beta-lactam-binding protein with PASTA domain